MKYKDLEGKTIKTINVNNSHVQILFTDNSCVYLGPDNNSIVNIMITSPPRGAFHYKIKGTDTNIICTEVEGIKGF